MLHVSTGRVKIAADRLVPTGGGPLQFAVPVAVGVHRKCADNRVNHIRGAILPHV